MSDKSYEWQVARLRVIADSAPDVYSLVEHKQADALGLPCRRSARLWTVCETSYEAFVVAKSWLNEHALYGFDFCVSEIMGQWSCTLSCSESLS